MRKAYLNHLKAEAHLDVIEKTDLPKVFGENVSKLRVDLGLTQDEIAYILGVSKQTYFRVEAGNNANINAEIGLKLAALFRVPVMQLFGYGSATVESYKKFLQCTPRTQRLLGSIMESDIKAQELLADFDDADKITVLKAAEEIRDGINANRFYYDVGNISEYRNFPWYEEADVLLEINSNAYHPVYHRGDRLVIASRTPLDGEIGIFIKGVRVFIRRNIQSPNRSYLGVLSRSDFGDNSDMIVDRRKPTDMNQYSKFGTVVAVI